MLRTTFRNRAGSMSVLSCVMLLVGTLAFGQAVTDQTITLRPGWNAIFLEVQPEELTPQDVFGDLEVASVWTWAKDHERVDFIENPGEGEMNLSDWLVWVPEDRTEHIATNLFAIFANNAYLVDFEGAAPIQITLSGEPELRRMSWVPNSFNLVGFHLDPSHPPNFGDFFSPSPAHQGQLIYRLAASGVWTPVASHEYMQPGESYWVYCEGVSNYEGPLSLELPALDGLDFSAFISTYELGLTNLGATRNVTIRMMPSSEPVPLTYRMFIAEDEGQVVWPAFSDPMVVQAATNQTVVTHWSVDRAAIEETSGAALMEVTDGAGSRYLIPVKAQKPTRATFSGLWIGNVTINAVSESQLGLMEPQPVGTPFTFRILIHVDAFGQARLLKEVIQMWEDGTYIVVNDPAPGEEPLYQTDQPGTFVLITDPDLIVQFEGATQRDGEPVGYRVSTAAYDFPENELLMNGAFDSLRSLTVQLDMEPDDPSNPFKHKYHPDHNNLDEQFLALPEGFEEARRYSRTFTLEFAELDPQGYEMPDGTWVNQPGWGSNIMGGVFSELISGVHKNDIAVSGLFRLNLVSTTDTLNAGGTP